MDIIDAHAHLWLRQKGKVDGRDVFPVGGGKSNFGGSIRQMMPPYMTDDANTAERFLANMDYARVSAAIIKASLVRNPRLRCPNVRNPSAKRCVMNWGIQKWSGEAMTPGE